MPSPQPLPHDVPWFLDDARDAGLSLHPLPASVVALLDAEGAPPRLVAHLLLVHDVSVRLLRALREAWPGLRFDADAVVWGAATHDIGKAHHREELSGPGKAHEAAGERLQLARGVPPTLARFARTHGARESTPDLALEDLLVILADTAWKGKRSRELDDQVVAALSAATGAPAWDVFLKLDTILEALAADADPRLAWHGRFPTG